MRRYLLHLLLLSLGLVLLTFALLYLRPEWFLAIMPLTVLYFAATTGTEHFFVARALHNSPRAFVKSFMGLTVGKLMLHLIVLSAYMFTHPHQARLFALGFAVCYIVYLVFETIALSRYVRNHHKKNTTSPDEK